MKRRFHYPRKVINELDSRKPTKTQIEPCCPICMFDLDDSKQWIVFYKCGHRTCSQCYLDLFMSARQSLQLKPNCPICEAVIEDTIALADK